MGCVWDRGSGCLQVGRRGMSCALFLPLFTCRLGNLKSPPWLRGGVCVCLCSQPGVLWPSLPAVLLCGIVGSFLAGFMGFHPSSPSISWLIGVGLAEGGSATPILVRALGGGT